MAEGTKDAMIIITTSWQALRRSEIGLPKTQICDNTVVILFASFFIEANLNYIIQKTKTKHNTNPFLKKHPGLQDKLGWFYNEFCASKKAKNRDELFKQGIERKIRRNYPGYASLYKFRNDLSHGKISKCAKSLENTKILRQQAKDIVDKLYLSLLMNKIKIPRLVDYDKAIELYLGS